MKRESIIAAVIISCAIVSACKKVLHITVHGTPDLLAFVLEDGVEIFPSSGSISVSEYDPKTQKWEYAWRTVHTGASQFTIEKFDYGRNPDGFVTLDEPRPLKSGFLYGVFLDRTNLYATGEFYIDNRSGSDVIVNILEPGTPEEILHRYR